MGYDMGYLIRLGIYFAVIAWLGGCVDAHPPISVGTEELPVPPIPPHQRHKHKSPILASGLTRDQEDKLFRGFVQYQNEHLHQVAETNPRPE
jgi:hypothetical protein